MKLTDKELVEAINYSEKKNRVSNFVELLQTTLKKEVKMSFGYMLGSIVTLMILSVFACALGVLLA